MDYLHSETIPEARVPVVVMKKCCRQTQVVKYLSFPEINACFLLI